MFMFLAGIILATLVPQNSTIQYNTVNNVKVSYETIKECKLNRIMYEDQSGFIVGNKYVFRDIAYIEKVSVTDYIDKDPQNKKYPENIVYKAIEVVKYNVTYKKDTLSYVICQIDMLEKDKYIDLKKWK